MLTYADVCWWDMSRAKMVKLTYADVWRMLTYADVCRLHVVGQESGHDGEALPQRGPSPSKLGTEVIQISN